MARRRGPMSKQERERLKDRVIRLYIRGARKSDIAEAVGCTEQTVENWIKQWKAEEAEKTSNAEPPAEVAEACQKYDEIYRCAMSEYSLASSANQRAAFLDKALSALHRRTSLLMEAGVVPKAVTQTTTRHIIEGVDLERASLEELTALKKRLLDDLVGEDSPDLLDMAQHPLGRN